MTDTASLRLLLTLIRINKQSRLNRRRQKLIPLDLLDELTIIVINPQVHKPTPRRPFPSTHKERVSVNPSITQDPQQAFPRVLGSGKLDPDASNVPERLLGEDVGPHVPRRDDVDPAAIVVRRAAQRVHHAPGCPLGRRVLRAPRAVEEGGARADEDEACVLLCGRGLRPVLLDEVVEGELGGVQGACDVDFCDAEVGFGGFLVVAWAPSVKMSFLRGVRVVANYQRTRIRRRRERFPRWLRHMISSRHLRSWLRCGTSPAGLPSSWCRI